MRTSELLRFAFRARDPLVLGKWYAELFEGQFFIHPVKSALGIVIVKLDHPESVFDGWLEFWSWDLEWNGGGGRASQDRDAAFVEELRSSGGKGIG